MQPKLIISFEALPQPEFLAKGELINNSLASNSNFMGPWPAPLSGPASLTTLYTAYQTAYNNAATGDTVKLAQRDAARLALTSYLKKLAPYLELVANGDVSKLLTSGYSLRKDNAHTGGGAVPPVPSDFKVIRGVGGQLIAKARKIRGVDAYEPQINTGNPNVEADWHSLPVMTSCAKIKIDGLTPLTKVWVRVRGVNSQGSGPWTDPAGETVL